MTSDLIASFPWSIIILQAPHINSSQHTSDVVVNSPPCLCLCTGLSPAPQSTRPPASILHCDWLSQPSIKNLLLMGYTRLQSGSIGWQNPVIIPEGSYEI